MQSRSKKTSSPTVTLAQSKQVLQMTAFHMINKLHRYFVSSTANGLNAINCYVFNAQSIVNKLYDLHHILYDVMIDCVLITETWLSSHISDGQLDPVKRYEHTCRDLSRNCGPSVSPFKVT